MKEGAGLWERLTGTWALISMECFAGHRLSLPGWVDEQRFLGECFSWALFIGFQLKTQDIGMDL